MNRSWGVSMGTRVSVASCIWMCVLVSLVPPAPRPCSVAGEKRASLWLSGAPRPVDKDLSQLANLICMQSHSLNVIPQHSIMIHTACFSVLLPFSFFVPVFLLFFSFFTKYVPSADTPLINDGLLELFLSPQ